MFDGLDEVNYYREQIIDLINKIDDSFNYLFNMSLLNLTKEKLVELKEQYNNKKTELDTIFNTSIENMWLTDLNELNKRLK